MYGPYELNCKDLECPCEPLTVEEYLKLTELEKEKDFERAMCRVHKEMAIFKWRYLNG